MTTCTILKFSEAQIITTYESHSPLSLPPSPSLSPLPILSDYILVAVWVLLLIAGLTIQTTVIQLRRRKHKRRQLVLSRNMRKKYNSFPHPSLLKKLLQYRKRKCPEGEPLLTPNHSHSPTHSQWSPVHSTKLPSNGRWSPGNSPVYPSNYGTTGATVNEPAYRRF